jgi:hypothetical protein
MRRTSIKVMSAALAVVIVSVASLGFLVNSQRYHSYVLSIVYCLCMPPQWLPARSEELLAANGWFKVDTGKFNLYAPAGTMIRPANAWDGQIVTPRFALNYELGAPTPARVGTDAVEEAVRIEGRDAVLRRATVPGSGPQYVATLFVPQALVRNGRPVSLLISGRFQSAGERAVADAMLVTVSFQPYMPPYWERQPPAVKAEPPVFDIAPDPA